MWGRAVGNCWNSLLGFADCVHFEECVRDGIDGFIVSWKSTEKLNRRLDQLVKLSAQENFKLVIIYEGLDFERNPLPVEQVNSDLNYFLDHYVAQPVFDLFGKPVSAFPFHALESRTRAPSQHDKFCRKPG